MVKEETWLEQEIDVETQVRIKGTIKHTNRGWTIEFDSVRFALRNDSKRKDV